LKSKQNIKNKSKNFDTDAKNHLLKINYRIFMKWLEVDQFALFAHEAAF